MVGRDEPRHSEGDALVATDDPDLLSTGRGDVRHPDELIVVKRPCGGGGGVRGVDNARGSRWIRGKVRGQGQVLRRGLHLLSRVLEHSPTPVASIRPCGDEAHERMRRAEHSRGEEGREISLVHRGHAGGTIGGDEELLQPRGGPVVIFDDRALHQRGTGFIGLHGYVELASHLHHSLHGGDAVRDVRHTHCQQFRNVPQSRGGGLGRGAHAAAVEVRRHPEDIRLAADLGQPAEDGGGDGGGHCLGGDHSHDCEGAADQAALHEGEDLTASLRVEAIARLVLVCGEAQR